MFSQSTILVSAVSLDIYQENGPVLPGGGCLNMAHHWWWQLDFPRHKNYFWL